MVRPSARGSEKGIPSSIASAPAPAAAVGRELRRERHRVGDRVGALQGRDDAFQSSGFVEGVKRLLIRDADVLGPLRIVEEGVLRSNARIIKTR